MKKQQNKVIKGIGYTKHRFDYIYFNTLVRYECKNNSLLIVDTNNNCVRYTVVDEFEVEELIRPPTKMELAVLAASNLIPLGL